MTVVAICIYNRIDNLLHWFECWRQCDTVNAKLVVIHNHYNEPGLLESFAAACKDIAEYIPSDKEGYDIGRFQDVCRGRIKLDYSLMLWCCDDTFPMAKDFIRQFENKHTQGTVVAMQISPYVRQHIRTTGFMIDRQTAEGLRFPVDPVTTKQHCYLFEHRDPDNHFLKQVNFVQVAPNETSPLWDVGYHRRIERSKKHIDLFGQYPLPGDVEQKETVTIICPIYNEFPAIISCLIMQTNKNWKLWLIHNGPSDGSGESFVNAVNDDRIEWMETDTYTANWGHQTRRDYLQKVKSKYVLITNPDNYYVPTFIEKCLKQFTIKGTTVGVYPEQIVHNYTDWKVMACRFQRGYIDCGQVVLKTKEAQEVGWNNITDHSADWLFFNDLARKYGSHKFMPIKGCLFIHN